MPVTSLRVPVPAPIDRARLRLNNGQMKESQLKEFGQRVRRRREALNLTRSALCATAGITRTTLRHLEGGSQHPSPATLDRLVAALQTTEDALTGTTPIAPDDPLLENLTDEDLEVAQAFHHAPTRVKQRVLGVLQERGRKPPLTGAAGELWRRFEQLEPDQRQAVAMVIAEMEYRTATPATTTPAVPAPARSKVSRR
jgi:transcriptional regulator with XRE-family HTH domain